MKERNKDMLRREPNFISYDDRTDLHKVVDKEEGVYLGHPSSVRMRDGKTIFMVYPKSHGCGQIVLKKSEDEGKTWSERLGVPQSFSTSLECPTIFRMEDASGKSRIFIFSGRYPFRVSVSEDDGEHFSELKPIGDFGGFFISTMISFGNGRYMALFHDEGAYIHGGKDVKNIVYRAGSGDDMRTRLFSYRSDDGGKTYSDEPMQYWRNSETEHEGDVWEPVYESYEGKVFPDKHFELYSIETEDGGLTWSSPKMICTHPTAKFCEPCAFRSPDGSEIAVLLRDNSRLYNSFVITSRDDGKTWSEPREVCDSLTGDRHMATYMDDGRLFITLRDKKKGSDLENNWVAWVGSYEDAISGKTGDCRILLKRHHFNSTERVPWDCAYPCVEKMEDGTILVATYGRWKENQEHYILSMRLTKDELKKIPYKEHKLSPVESENCRQMKVLAFGEVLWDVYTNSEHLGGAPLNFSAHFKKCGGKSWISTAVGDDQLGRKTICEIEKLGINTEYITIAEQETGKCLVTLDENQIPSYKLLDNVAYDYIQNPDTNNRLFDVLYFGTLALRNENNRKVLGRIINENRFGDVFVDVNIWPPYYSGNVVRFACANATIIKISDEELPAIMGVLDKEQLSIEKCAQMISEEFSNLRMIIITRGDKGAVVYECKDKEYYECKAHKTQVVSTVGAGDSFSAAFLTKYIKTNNISKALNLATKVSGYVVSCREAIPQYELKDFE